MEAGEEESGDILVVIIYNTSSLYLYPSQSKMSHAVDAVRIILEKLVNGLLIVAIKIGTIVDTIVYGLDKTWSILLTNAFNNPLFLVILLGVVWLLTSLVEWTIRKTHPWKANDGAKSISPAEDIMVSSVIAWLFTLWIMIAVISRLA